MPSRKDLLCSLVGRVEAFSFIPLFPLCNLWQGDSTSEGQPRPPGEPSRVGAGGARKGGLSPGVSHRSPGCVPALAPGHVGFTSPSPRTLAAALILV